MQKTYLFPLQIGILLANDVERHRIFSYLIFPCIGKPAVALLKKKGKPGVHYLRK